MTDFSDALNQRLAENDELAKRRKDAEADMDRIRKEEQAAAAAISQSQHDRHAKLVAHLDDVAGKLKASAPNAFIVRSGWTPSGEEFVATMKTRQMSPKRELLVEVDRDDDEVLCRWTSDLGSAVEVWRLLEMSPAMITHMVLQVADDTAWTGRRPPPFPGGGTSEGQA